MQLLTADEVITNEGTNAPTEATIWESLPSIANATPVTVYVKSDTDLNATQPLFKVGMSEGKIPNDGIFLVRLYMAIENYTDPASININVRDDSIGYYSEQIVNPTSTDLADPDLIELDFSAILNEIKDFLSLQITISPTLDSGLTAKLYTSALEVEIADRTLRIYAQ